MRFTCSAVLAAFLFFLVTDAARASELKVLVSAGPTSAARINPKLFGNFIELLEDVVPGTWAEMLNDRSFEGVTRPANWCYYDGAPTFCDRQWDPTGTWSYETNNVFNGQRCASLTATSLLPAALTQSGLSVTKGTYYHFSGYLRANDARVKASVLLKALLPDGKWMSLASADLPQIDRAWQKYSLDLPSSGTTDRAVFELRVEGQGSVWADKLSLMPSDNLSGWRRDVIEAVQDVRPAVIRWGGSACDPGQYRWKNGIGDRDQRTSFANQVWGRIDSNDVGIDEFCQFCALVHAEPLICLSFSDGPQSAADLVQYCNGGPETPWGARRVTNGHPSAYKVKYWQVGNEISGESEEYLTRLGDFIRLMKARDPSMELCSSFPSRKLIERFGSDLAFVCPHHYTTDFDRCDRELGELTRLLGTMSGCEHTRIAVTEWNVSGGDWGLMRGRQMTLQAALLNARYLNLLMRHAERVEMACRSNLANSFCGAIIETSPSGLLKRPSYHVMRLYAHHFKPLPLQLLLSADTPDLFACASETKSAVVVFGVNSASEPVKASFQFSGFAKPIQVTSAEAVCDTLDARQPDVMNHWNALTRVSTRPLEPASNEVIIPAFSVVAIECAAF
jgi:alpha-L-arabinofuranosidase